MDREAPFPQNPKHIPWKDLENHIRLRAFNMEMPVESVFHSGLKTTHACLVKMIDGSPASH